MQFFPEFSWGKWRKISLNPFKFGLEKKASQEVLE